RRAPPRRQMPKPAARTPLFPPSRLPPDHLSAGSEGKASCLKGVFRLDPGKQEPGRSVGWVERSETHRGPRDLKKDGFAALNPSYKPKEPCSFVQPDRRQILVDVVARIDFPALYIGPVQDAPVSP